MRAKFMLLLLLTVTVFTTKLSVAAPADYLTNGWSNAESSLPPSTQLLLVTTKDWNAVTGQLRRFARKNAHSENPMWVEVGSPIPIVVGRSGVGWGRGFPLPVALPGPIKKEGDGKSPAGIFRLSSAFGLVAAAKLEKVTLPYRQLTNGIECVDDVKSTHYNSIVDRSQIARPDWDSSEKMAEITPQYRLGIVVDHNVNPAIPGSGSCIFMHIWKDATTGTSGCTAMAPEQMESLLPWLKPDRHPLLVQMPEAEFEAMRKYLLLPKLK
jgi:D-alanyl-D-alanine dipeptidase